MALSQKHAGAYYTPAAVAETLVRWVAPRPSDRLLDPSCGDGRFIALHKNSIGIEQDATATRQAMERAPWALVHEGDFFAWASNTNERFECAAGNPPFIRYQTFSGATRERAVKYCAGLGAQFSGLASSWAPFLVAAASLLKLGGRLAFVVPAEIGHAPYSSPVLEYFADNFSLVHVVAVRSKLFAELSEDCWLLYASGRGGKTQSVRFSTLEKFSPCDRPPRRYDEICLREWREIWGQRLRPFLLPRGVRDWYGQLAADPSAQRLGDVARVGIGYVSGANDFFHLRPSQARTWNIPRSFLLPTVRNGRALSQGQVTRDIVAGWLRNDDPVLLLRIAKRKRPTDLPDSVRRYLATSEAKAARTAFKCRVRDPWYAVPDVQVPDLFLSYMSGLRPTLVQNQAGCTGTNSVHVVRLTNDMTAAQLKRWWDSPFVQLSCEVEGHPLGGGMLKLEPREAAAVLLPSYKRLVDMPDNLLADALATMRAWRHFETQGTA